MANELPITANGEKKLRDELNQLIKVEREEIKQKINLPILCKDFFAHGDFTKTTFRNIRIS
mgnify:CR=1 FL=1